MPKLVHYYHIYCDGSWQEPWDDQIKALINSGLYEQLDSMKVGIVGGSPKCREVRNALQEHKKVEIVAESRGGWEQVTLDVLHSDIMETEDEPYVLYGHTKGAAYYRPVNTWWRRDMVDHCVGRWEASIELLDSGYDAVGIYWRRGPMDKNSPVSNHHFSGNFWWATTPYLRTLGAPLKTNRYDAEAWIGNNQDIKAFDLHPGVPKIRDVGKPVYGHLLKPPPTGTFRRYYVMNQVQGPFGVKLTPGTIVELNDSEYVQVLLRGGHIVTWNGQEGGTRNVTR